MRNYLLFAAFCLFATPAFAVDTAQIMDVPASEYIEEDAVSKLDSVIKTPAKNENTDKDTEKKLVSNSDKTTENNIVMLRGLNKVIGRISTLEIPLGTISNFENLEIIARKCWKAPPEDRPENAALLEINEIRAGEAPKQIFLGWMFSSSPSISGLEHPVYDITMLSCEYRKNLEN